MSKSNSLGDFLLSLANTIRSKLGTQGAINPQDFDAKIEEVYNKGSSDNYDSFWDAYQANGRRSNYQFAFAGYSWNDSTFNPKYQIKPTILETGFMNSQINTFGVGIDTSSCTNFYRAFYNTSFTELPAIDLSSSTYTHSIFMHSSKLTKIEKLIFSESTSSIQSLFTNNRSLTTCTFEGTLAANGLNVSETAFNHDSLVSLIGILKDYRGTDTTRTITFGSTLKAKLSAEELAEATNKGWTVA